MKVLVFIEHDIVVRHFVHSGVFRPLAARHDVLFVFPEEGHKRVTTDIGSLDLPAPFVRLAVDQRRRKLWKRLFQVNLLRWRRGRQQAVLRNIYRRLLGWKAALLYTAIGLPGVYQSYRRYAMATLAAHPYGDLEALIAEQRPDVIVHPSVLEGEYINDLVDVSQRHGIPFAVIMNSWDNPSTKSAVIGKPDWLLVWGPQTKRHAIDYMGMRPEHVVVFGAAQFDVYRGAPRLDREAFCRAHDIDPAANVLLYAGSSKETDEFAHLVAIDGAIAQGRLGNAVVVYRPHPWGNCGKDGGRILDYAWQHVRIESTMRGYLERVRGGDLSMSFPDYRNTHDVLSSVDALISPLSTIILEGALHGRPVLCFMPEDETTARHFQLAVPMVHFEDMFRSPEVLVARGRAELITGLESLISRVGDDVFGARLCEACAYFVETFDRPYGERLVDFVEEIAGSVEHPYALPSVVDVHGGAR